MAKEDDKLLESFRKSLDEIESTGSKVHGKSLNLGKKPKKRANSGRVKKSKKEKTGEKPVVVNPRSKKKKSKSSDGKIGRRITKVMKTGYPTLNLKTPEDIGMDFAEKVYKKFDKIIKSIVLFGSASKKTSVASSDIDIIIIVDDATIRWDEELVAWYREELEKIVMVNPYGKKLHINTIKLTTWFQDMIRGDPIVINIIRDGEPLIDFGGFFEPLKYLLLAGKIKSTPEAVYSLLERAPQHISRSKISELNSIEGLFWAMVDSSHAALISAGRTPPSPEKIPIELKETFVDDGKLKMKYVIWYRDLFIIHKKIAHGEITELKGVEIDEWQGKTEEFLKVMARLVNDIVG